MQEMVFSDRSSYEKTFATTFSILMTPCQKNTSTAYWGLKKKEQHLPSKYLIGRLFFRHFYNPSH